MAVAIPTLDNIVQEYLNDADFQGKRRSTTTERNATLPTLGGIVRSYIEVSYPLVTFREQLQKQDPTFIKVSYPLVAFREQLQKQAPILRRVWGADHLLQELNKLVKNHLPSNNDVEPTFRFILKRLNADNIGECIELLYSLLTDEQKRLAQLGKNSSERASPGSSAFIVSLLAFWLDGGKEPFLYYPSFRSGLAMLLKARVLPAPSQIPFNIGRHRYPTVDIVSKTTHQAVAQVITNLASAAPKLKADSADVYWAEYFLAWVGNRYNPELTGPAESGTDEQPEIDEQEMPEATEPPITDSRRIISDTNLAPLSQEVLAERIAEVQKNILVDEEVIRRIYYALLAGHVILTGPPGTGKTELARIIPEILWQNEHSYFHTENEGASIPTAYTTTLITATEEWTTRTLISSIVPAMDNGLVAYKLQYGHLTNAILKNWSIIHDQPATWLFPQRMTFLSESDQQHLRGLWLIIDEFNRSHIDTALGEALTALGGSQALLVNCADGIYRKLPIPKDFRIIGTLNSFDRNYLNRISEALKRRFSFVEVLPPSRKLRLAEQRMVRYKALESIAHLLEVETDYDDAGGWRDYAVNISGKQEILITLNVGLSNEGESGENSYYTSIDLYQPLPRDSNSALQDAFQRTFEAAWSIFEVIRLYRQLGTAQAISLVRYILIAALMSRSPQNEGEWIAALDMALCDTIADQLQILLPDELDALIWYLTLDTPEFINQYTNALSKLASKPRRFKAQLEVLQKFVSNNGGPPLSEQQIESLIENTGGQLRVLEDALKDAFHLDEKPPMLPQFVGRLRTFKAEHGL